MLLSEVFLPEFIMSDLQSSNKEDTFKEMTERFCQVTGKDVREEILKALREREAKMSTGIQNGIAIPHGKTTVVEKVYGVLGISRKGIDYDSLDGKPVHLVMMLLAPPVEAEHHLHLLQRMADFLRKKDFYSDITGAANSEEVFNTIKKYENEASKD